MHRERVSVGRSSELIDFYEFILFFQNLKAIIYLIAAALIRQNLVVRTRDSIISILDRVVAI